MDRQEIHSTLQYIGEMWHVALLDLIVQLHAAQTAGGPLAHKKCANVLTRVLYFYMNA